MNEEALKLIEELLNSIQPLKVDGISVLQLDTRLNNAYKAAEKYLFHNK